MFRTMVLTARLLLGVFYLVGGFNWFFGYMPLPSMHSPPDAPIRHDVIREMIQTGWMFQGAKVLEIVFGLSLIFNRGVPLMLVVAMPVGVGVFLLDAFILDDIWGWLRGVVTTDDMLAAIYQMVIGGLCVFLIHLWLVWCYMDYYRPMLVWKATPKEAGQ